MARRKLLLGVTVMLALTTVPCIGAINPPVAAARLAWSGPFAHDGGTTGPPHYSAVACSLASQCTAVDETGDEVTFDPRGGTVLTAANVDPGAQAIFALTCPSAEQCTAVDLAGDAVTFDPRSPASLSSRRLAPHRALLAVACPTSNQCTAVVDDRHEITFNPHEPRWASDASLGTRAGTGVTGLACPSVTSCIVVDGAGELVGFNPRHPGRPKPVRLLNDAAIAVACPSAAECVLVAAGGERVTFATNPTGATPALKRGQVSAARVDPVQPNALACPSVTYCVVVDSAGRAVEFDPGGSGATTTSTIAAGESLSGVACATPALCVAVDSAGDAFSGVERLPATPVARGRPRVSGEPLQGHRLRGSARVWSGVRTSLRLQWERCSQRGTSCHPIAGANGRSYALTAADAGHTLRLVEQAANQAGLGPAVVSAATRRVRGLPAGPAVSHLSLSGLVDGRPRLAFDLRASAWGPKLQHVTVRLPAGLSARRHASRALELPFRAFGIGTRAGGLWAGSFVVLGRGEGVELNSAPAARLMRVDLRGGGLSATHRLVEQARRHLRTKLSLTVSVLRRRGRPLRSTAPITLGRRHRRAPPVEVSPN